MRVFNEPCYIDNFLLAQLLQSDGVFVMYAAGDTRMADAAGTISSDHDNEQDEGNQSDDGMSDSNELVLSEDIIIMTMEVTSLPRHQVIDLLLHNDGDPQAVLAQLFP